MTDPVPSALSSVGQTLRNRRLQKSFTIEQSAQDTRIHIKHIRALEEEQWGEFPARVYLEGFLKRYAEYLGLSPEEMVSAFRLAATDSAKPKFAGPGPVPNPGDESAAPGIRPLSYAVGVGAVLFALVFSYVKLEERRASLEKQASPVLPVPVEPSAPTVKTFEAALSAKVPVWVRVWIDGQVKFEGILQAGAVKKWTLESSLRLSAGNLAFVTLAVDGAPVAPPPGVSSGELRWEKPAPAPAVQP